MFSHCVLPRSIMIIEPSLYSQRVVDSLALRLPVDQVDICSDINFCRKTAHRGFSIFTGPVDDDAISANLLARMPETPFAQVRQFGTAFAYNTGLVHSKNYLFILPLDESDLKSFIDQLLAFSLTGRHYHAHQSSAVISSFIDHKTDM